MLVSHFIEHYGGGRSIEVSAAAHAALDAYPYPGNVRELEHVIQQALVLAEAGPIDVMHLPAEITGMPSAAAPVRPPDVIASLAQALFDFEGQYLARAMREAGGVKHLAAESLGISRKNLWQKLRRHGVIAKDKRP